MLRRPWAFGAAVLGFTLVAIYVGLIASEGGASFFPVALFALLMTLGAFAALFGAQTADQHKARIAIVAAAAIFTIVGIVSFLSIGIGFLIGRLRGLDCRRSIVQVDLVSSIPDARRWSTSTARPS